MSSHQDSWVGLEHQIGSSRVVTAISGSKFAAVSGRVTVAKLMEALEIESREQARMPGGEQEFVSAKEKAEIQGQWC